MLRCRLANNVRCVVRLGRVFVPDLFRFQRIQRYGNRTRPDARLRISEELRLAVHFEINHRVLAAVAPLIIAFPAGLFIHSPGRKPKVNSANIHKYNDRHASRRPLARSFVELRHLGSPARNDARLRANNGQRQHLSQSPERHKNTAYVFNCQFSLGILPSANLALRTRISRCIIRPQRRCAKRLLNSRPHLSTLLSPDNGLSRRHRLVRAPNMGLHAHSNLAKSTMVHFHPVRFPGSNDNAGI